MYLKRPLKVHLKNKEEGFSGTTIKDTWTKLGGEDQGWEVGMAGVRESGGEGMETTVLEQQKINK